MNPMNPRLLRKSDLNKFLESLKEYGELIAPVKTDILRFSAINDVKDVCIEGHPLFTAKKYFYKPKHVLFNYDNLKVKEVKHDKKRVIFGMRLCDINALLKLDKLFLGDIEDSVYEASRKNTLLIGLNCETAPNPSCFCESMELHHSGYDLFFCDMGEDFHIIVGSDKGEMFVKDLPESFSEPQPIRTEKRLNKKDVKKIFDHPEWKKAASKCISCGACTALCPDCLCFDVYDEPNLNIKSGSRIVEWDSCQFKDFTEVAGGHIFRNDRENRLKHRIYHKIQYFREKFNEDMCTGCGRCIDGCPTKIDFVKIINDISDK